MEDRWNGGRYDARQGHRAGHDVFVCSEPRAYNWALDFNANRGSGFSQSYGTSAGTVPVTSFAPGVSGFIYADFSLMGGRAAFVLEDANRTSLWSTDGTAGGTTMLQQIRPTDQALVEIQPDFMASGNWLFYDAYSAPIGSELYVTDGTTAGTSFVSDIYPVQKNPFVRPSFITPLSGGALFVVDAEVSGNELWFSDGTPGGTYFVYDILAD